jgi:hypothetical protein
MTTEVDWTNIHERLSRPFPKEAVRTLPGRGGSKGYSYVTARTVMNRLDDVVGPGNWQAHFEVADAQTGAVKCSLEIYGVTREDFGDPNNPVKGERSNAQIFKEAASDALKRAAVLFGVARYIYEPAYEDEGSESSREQDAKDQKDGGSDLFREYVILRDQFVSLSDEYPNAAALEKKLKAVINVPEDTLMRDVNLTVLQRLIDTLKARIENAKKVPA